MCVKRSHGREISIELKTGMKCVAARSIKSATEFVFAHVKDTGRLAYWNYVMLSVLVKQYTCQLFHALFFPHYLLHLSLIQCLYIQLCFLFNSHLNWSG